MSHTVAIEATEVAFEATPGQSLLDAAEHSDLPAYADWALYARVHGRNLQQTYLRLEAAGVGR